MRKIFLCALVSLTAMVSKTNAQVTRWYSYSDYVINNSTAATGDWGGTYLDIWKDTTSKFYYSGGTPGYYRNYFVSSGISFAPRLAAWDNVSTYGSTIKVGPTDAFSIDSVRIQGYYMRNNLITAPKDTLRFGFVYGNGASTTNIGSAGTSYSSYGSVNFIDMLYDSINNRAGKHPSVATQPFIQSIVLSNTDTSSDFIRTYAVLNPTGTPTPYAVPAGMCAAMSLSFKSGDPSYVANDTIRYASGAYKHGSFQPLVIYYASSLGDVAWAPFSSIDSNMGYYKRIPQLDWSGYYVPQWGWTTSGVSPSSLQVPVIEFHIKCNTCRLNDNITGTATLCQGATTTLAHSLPGGSWSSSATSIATVGTSGIVTGVAGGTATITYGFSFTGGNNFTTQVVTVTPLPSAGMVTGASSVCQTGTILLTPTVTGGTWSSSSTAVAIVTSMGDVTGIAGGSVNITYTVTNSCGSAFVTFPVTVNPLPTTPLISGSTTVCVGSSTTLTGAPAGGTWASTSGLVTIAGAGSVTGVTAGIDIISYTVTNSCGSAMDTAIMNVSPAPSAGTITGASTVCIGAAIILSSTVTGGTWSASNGNATVTATGDVTGVVAGPVNIIYTVTSPCATVTAVQPVTVLDCSTGVFDIQGATGDISIFPNPTRDNITITSASNIGNVVVSNMLGQKVLSTTCESTTANINLALLPQGIYTVRVNDSMVFKVVKQ